MKPILWKLATKQLAQDDATRLVFYWGFSAEQIKAVQSQYTGRLGTMVDGRTRDKSR